MESPTDNPFQFAAPPPDELSPPESLPVNGLDSVVAPEPTESSPVAYVGPPSIAAGRSNWLLAILIPYALFMTVMGIYYYVKYSTAVNETPLDQIPDLLGQFQQKQTRGTPQSRLVPLPPPDQPLPARLLTTMGKPLEIGAIEVTPLSIECGPWTGFTKTKTRAKPRKHSIEPTLILHVRLRNISTDLTFYPTDPYFDRNPKQPSDKPYTLVDVGGRKYFGGLIEYDTERGNVERTWLAGQENDDQPLAPGESRETVLVARPGDHLFEALQKATAPAVWRMQVRRGLMTYRGTEIPVSAVVGVAFTTADVRKIG